MNVLAISYGRNLFSATNPERARMKACAGEVESLRIIVFARTKENLAFTQDENLFLYPSGGTSKIGMLINAYILGRNILKQYGSKSFIITTQDPFEAGLIGYILAKFFSIPLNIQEHGDFFSTSHWRRESMFNTLRYLLGIFLLRQATTVRVVSKRIKNTLIKKGVNEAVIRELSVAVPIAKFLQATPSTKSRELFESEAIIVLSVARFVPQKNLSLLISAFADAYKNESRLRLLLIGEGPEEQNLLQLIASLFPQNHSKNIIKIIPWTNDVPAYMKSADIYALTSNYEGYARVLPEAMASELPIITTDVGCVGEVCIHNSHALVVPVDSKTNFAEALSTLSQNNELQIKFKYQSKQTMETLINTSDTYPKDWLKSL